MLCFRDFSLLLADKFTNSIVLLCPLLASIFWIFIFEKYLIRKNIPFEFQPNFLNHKLYVFIPDVRTESGSASMPNILLHTVAPFNTNFVYPAKKDLKKQLVFGKQIDSLIMDFKFLNRVNFTTTGELVVNDEALKIFQRNNLTGYQA